MNKLNHILKGNANAKAEMQKYQKYHILLYKKF